MRLSLRSKFSLAIVAPLLLMVLSITIILPTMQRRSATSALTLHARSLVEVLANLVTPAVDLDSAKDAEAQLKSVQSDKTVLALAIVRPEGTAVYAEYHRPGVTPLASPQAMVGRRDPVIGHSLLISQPLVKEGGQVIGTLVGSFSLEDVRAGQSASVRLSGAMGAGMLLFGLLLAWALSGRLARPLSRAAERVGNVAHDLLGAAREHEAAASQGAAAVEETRRTIDALLGAAQQIADSSSHVLGNAEHTLEGTKQIGERIQELTTHSEKVAEFLTTIMQVADRTDLLALNAALEGAKAGEAGKGFALVAVEMRRLAENVMESVAGIRRLMKDIRAASQGAIDSSRSGTHVSEETAVSAREIALVTQQQRQATEQVSNSMDEMTQMLQQNMASVRQTTRAASDLAELAGALSALVAEGDKRANNGRAIRRPGGFESQEPPSAAV